MAKKIYGDISASGNIQINGSNTIRDVNGFQADANGNINIPTYTKSYIDKLVSMMPISRVGTLDYLPLNISGSFSGATNYIGKGIYPNIIESDGTLVYLRPGTNGSTFGYYYSYIKNARTSTNLQPVLTSSLFKPVIFTDNHTLIKFVGSNANDILMMRANDSTQDTYVLSITNKTLNADSHNSVEFPASLISSDPQYAMIENNLIYIWCMEGYSNTSELSISLYTMTVADLKAGTYNTLQKNTGFNGTNLYGDSVTSSDNIKLTDTIFSNDIADKPLYNIPTGNTYRSFSPFWGNTEGSIQAAGNGEGSIRIAFFHSCEAATQQTNIRSEVGVSLVYNISTKQYTIDTPNTAPVVITMNSAGAISYNNPFSINSLTQTIGLSLNSSLNKQPSFFVTNDGVQFVCLSRHDSSPEHYVGRSNVSGFTTLYDSWKLPDRKITSNLLSSVEPSFGSAIGENMIHPTIINSTKILMHCAGTVDGEFYGYDTTVYTSLGAARNYSYKSVISGGTLNGYAPNADRGILDNSDYRWTGTITTVNTSGTTNVYGTSFIEGLPAKYSGGLLNQSNMTFNNQYSLSSTALLTTMKNELLAKSSITGAVIDSHAVLYYVPDSTYTKSYAMLTVMNDAATGSNNSFVVFAEVDIIVSGTTITTINTNASTVTTIARGIAASSLSSGLMARQGGMVIAQYSDFTYVGIPGLFAVNTSASNFHSLVMKMDNTTKLISTTPKMISTGYNSSSANTYEVGVLPGIGFGVFENGNITDIKTKLVFKNFGTTSSQFDTMISNFAGTPVERIVVASQEVAEGFVLYFTQTVPVLLNGNYHELPATSIDLTTIVASPANKTFYLYVVDVEGSAQYQLSTTLLSEELYRIFIGTIVTGASGISSISTEKVTRFLTYRTSTTQRGSAIPTSTGVPSGSGTRWK